MNVAVRSSYRQCPLVVSIVIYLQQNEQLLNQLYASYEPQTSTKRRIFCRRAGGDARIQHEEL
jgi:hypothetical protein